MRRGEGGGQAIGAGDGECGANEALWYGCGVCEVGIGGYGVDQVEAGSGEGAGRLYVGGAVGVGEGGETDEGGKGNPVAGSAVGGYCAEPDGAEGRSAEGLQGIKGAEEGVGVLENETTGGDREGGVKPVVGAGDIDLSVAGKWRCGFEGEGEELVGGQVVLTAQPDSGVRDVANVLAEEGDDGARGLDKSGQNQGTTVFEGEGGVELFPGLEFGCGDTLGKGHSQGCG